MILLGLDLETGGAFDAPIEENFVTEVGAVLYDTKIGQPVRIYSELLHWEDENISHEATEYTGITNDLVQRWGQSPKFVACELRSLIKSCDAIVAHNGLGFDKPILVNWSELKESVNSKPWIDTTIDVPYPNNCRSRNLTYLTAFHRLMNPFPHRAVTDVMLMLEILNLYDVDDIFKTAQSPLVKVVANVSFAEKDLAKAQGFMWDGTNKKWYKNRRKRTLDNTDTDAWGFNYSLEECGN